jgi:hypothetical protein
VCLFIAHLSRDEEALVDDEIRRAQDALRRLDTAATECVGTVRDPALDLIADDGRTVRQLLHALSDHYRERVEQLLWTKWGQRIPRSETKRILAELQGVRAQFAAYLSDLRDEQLGVASAAAQGASARDVVGQMLEEERRTMDLIRGALARSAR